MTKHVNNGACAKCAELFDRYPNFNPQFRAWFEMLQTINPDAHISCAGRGREDQEHFFDAGTSRAHFGESAHNYNAAIDIFRLTLQGAEWGRPWFEEVVEPAIEAAAEQGLALLWYGRKGAPYFELPHVELKDWQSLGLALVEP